MENHITQVGFKPKSDERGGVSALLGKGASIKDVPSKSGLFDPLPPCPPYDVIVTIKVALLCPLWADPPSPLTWDVLSGWPLTINFAYLDAGSIDD